MNWESIKPPPPGMVQAYGGLSEPTAEELTKLTEKLAVLKLNGGLGTSMGCKGPKSVIQVRNDLSFLDLTVMQIEHLTKTYGTKVPLLLMNSFNTDDDTADILRKYAGTEAVIKTFNQSKFPRLYRDTMKPAPESYAEKAAWFPPGHGDLYRSLEASGMLDELIAQGKEYLFVSNIDNLGAGVDFKILKSFADNVECEFIMEVTDKTRADVKGGTLIEYDGKLRLLEIAQVPKEHTEDFKSITKVPPHQSRAVATMRPPNRLPSARQFRIFNTNNLWMRLSAIKRILETEDMHMEVIENKKMMGEVPVIQLEQAVGSAIKNFRGSIGINVPRSRFLPVKQCQDLLLVKSDLFMIRSGTLLKNEARLFGTLPLVKLGKEFKKVDDFMARFDSVPKVLELDHLTVTGDVCFGRGVTLKGTVIIIARDGEHIDIPPNALLENKIVTGSLRVTDH